MQSRNTANNMAYRFLLPLLLALAALPAEARLYKWVDENGKVHYTDTPPPESASRGNAELSKTGNVVRKTESAEERQRRLAAEAEEARRKREAEEQARRDRALLATYTSEAEIDLARDRALEHHRSLIKSAEARLKLLEPGERQLAEKVEAAAKAGKPVPAHLERQYQAKHAEAEDARNTIRANEEAMVKVRERYEAEKQRFRELTAKR